MYSILILQQSEDFSGPIRGGSALACYWGLKVFIYYTYALTWLGNQDLSAELGLSHGVGEDVMCSECNGALGTSDTSVLISKIQGKRNAGLEKERSAWGYYTEFLIESLEGVNETRIYFKSCLYIGNT